MTPLFGELVEDLITIAIMKVSPHNLPRRNLSDGFGRIASDHDGL